jgi:hypothetical protein
MLRVSSRIGFSVSLTGGLAGAVQFQNVQGAGLDQFKTGHKQVIVYPPLANFGIGTLAGFRPLEPGSARKR